MEWNERTVPTHDKYQGQMYANFKRRGGDYMGIAGKPNDGSSITTSVLENYPNDFGLYNMAGNVNEWLEDLYLPLTTTVSVSYTLLTLPTTHPEVIALLPALVQK